MVASCGAGLCKTSAAGRLARAWLVQCISGHGLVVLPAGHGLRDDRALDRLAAVRAVSGCRQANCRARLSDIGAVLQFSRPTLRSQRCPPDALGSDCVLLYPFLRNAECGLGSACRHRRGGGHARQILVDLLARWAGGGGFARRPARPLFPVGRAMDHRDCGPRGARAASRLAFAERSDLAHLCVQGARHESVRQHRADRHPISCRRRWLCGRAGVAGSGNEPSGSRHFSRYASAARAGTAVRRGGVLDDVAASCGRRAFAGLRAQSDLVDDRFCAAAGRIVVVAVTGCEPGGH